MTTEHTPIPWSTQGGSYIEGDTDCASVFSLSDAEKRPCRAQGDNAKQALANAKFIVQACNAHDDLLAACQKIADRDCEYTGSAGCNLLPQGVMRTVCGPCAARAAIAKATD